MRRGVLPMSLLMRRYSGILQAAVSVFLLCGVVAIIGIGPAGIGSGRYDSAHEQADCGNCHTFVASTNAAPPVNRSAQCLSCHSKRPSSTGLAFHNGNRDCLECHNYHRTGMLLASDREFHFNFNSDRLVAQCRTCHHDASRPRNLSPGHEAAVSVYHSDSYQLSGLTPSQGCLLCHSRTTRTMAPSTGSLEPPRFSEHASHPVGQTVVPGSGRGRNKIRTELDPRLELYNGRIECQTCHSMTSQTTYLLADFESTTALCQGCHEHGRR